MKKFLYIISLFLLAACDDGDIVEKYTYQQEGIKVAVDVNISGTESWPDGYSVTLSGFANQKNDKDIAEYSEISKQIIPTSNGKIHIALGGIPQSVNYLEITVLNRIRQRTLTVWQHELTSDEKNRRDTITIDAGTLNAGMFHYIQTEYFDKSCANCHGLSEGGAAAGLYLTNGKSYAAMVNAASHKRPSINVVTPGDTANSALHLLLHGRFPEVKHNHKDKLATDHDKEIIDLWILSGAGEE
ncbi:MAG: hypothetical protein J6T70_19060 [Bacteroidales bacterium]|nr:hypothetical protein [Bacteroidales bacterium]